MASSYGFERHAILGVRNRPAACLLLFQKPIDEVGAFDAVSFAVEFVERKDVFRVIVFHGFKRRELALDGRIACKQIAHLEILRVVVLASDEVDFLIADFPDSYVVAAATMNVP